jgi:Ca2+:H+ antiporter
MDGEGRIGRRRSPRHHVRTRDFESGSVELDKLQEAPRKHSKRHKHTKRHSKKSEHSTLTEVEKGPDTVSTVVEAPVNQDNGPSPPRIAILDPESTTNSTPRPFNMRQISEAVHHAGLNSSLFPHHAATGRPLAIPLQNLRPPSQPRSPNSESLRRTSSMPDMVHRTLSSTRPTLARGLSPSDSPAFPGESAPEATTEDIRDEKHHLSKTSAVITLLCTTGLVALCAEFLVGSLDYLISSSGVSQAFIGLIILPIVGNAAEHVTAVTVAAKNKMDLAIGIALGSSIQIAIFVTPLMVILGWIIDREMSLYFSLFEVVALFASTLIVSFLLIDGRSNYLEGSLLIAAYVIIAISAFFYPTCDLSTISGPLENVRGCPPSAQSP